jgi:hypothetical protein
MTDDNWTLVSGRKKRRDRFYDDVTIYNSCFKQQTKTNKKVNHKKILCHNMITHDNCNYDDRCVYAHSLKDQNVDYNRKRTMEIIIGTDDLGKINLTMDRELYKNLMIMTKMCPNCEMNKCTGGYNCKYGVCEMQYLVCGNDLNYGKCTLPNCLGVHLTKRNLKPYYQNVICESNRHNYTCGILLTDEFFEMLRTNSAIDNIDHTSDSSIDCM